jgi:hypothetical protein
VKSLFLDGVSTRIVKLNDKFGNITKPVLQRVNTIAFLQLNPSKIRETGHVKDALGVLDLDGIRASIYSAGFSCCLGSLPAPYGPAMARKAESREAGINPLNRGTKSICCRNTRVTAGGMKERRT